MKKSVISYFLSLLFVVIFFIFIIFLLIALGGIPVGLEKYLDFEAFSFNIRNSNAILDHIIELDNSRAELYDVILGYYLNNNNKIKDMLKTYISKDIEALGNSNISFGVTLDDEIIGNCNLELVGSFITYETPNNIISKDKIEICPPVVWLATLGAILGENCEIP